MPYQSEESKGECKNLKHPYHKENYVGKRSQLTPRCEAPKIRLGQSSLSIKIITLGFQYSMKVSMEAAVSSGAN